MQLDDISKLLLEAVLCKDEQQKEALFQKAFQLEVDRIQQEQQPIQPTQDEKH